MRDFISAFDFKHGSEEHLVIAVINRLIADDFLQLRDGKELKELAIYEGKAGQWFNKLKSIYREEYPTNFRTYY